LAGCTASNGSSRVYVYMYIYIYTYIHMYMCLNIQAVLLYNIYIIYKSVKS
jgi:hypothetical protein